jgi:hypothetical protein
MRAASLPALTSILAIMLLGLPAAAQNPPPPEQTAAPSPSSPTGQTAAPFRPEQLDQLTAPIALYPDPLVGQILMAATYPLEVVEANRWLQQPANAALKGDELAAVLAQQRWDPSVESLVAFPQILQMMDGNLTWIEQLGDAFLADQTAVMDSVQRLRHKAAAAGELQSTPQQAVSDEGGVIIIEPPDQDIVYVPVYAPSVYGAWPYPEYPPDYFPGFFPDAAIGPRGFGWMDFGIVAPLWGWAGCDWGRHRINIDAGRFGAGNAAQPAIASGVWQHDPSHRGGVPYRDLAVRTRYQSAATAAAIQAARGFPVVAPPAPAQLAVNTARPAAAAVREPTVLRPGTELARLPASGETAPGVLRPAPPVVQSLGSGPEVRAQAERGQASRISAPAPRVGVVAAAPAPRVAAPAPRAVLAPQGRGEHR